ncbi:MAG: hypothetical protein IIA89_15695 [Chloroflexi bacterium]|nr:hypothetical protein [Chloroflexota bacterium]
MGQITLVVTSAELDHYNAGHALEAQIALRSPSPDIAPTIEELTSKNRANLILGGHVTLVAGDPGAVWRAHNNEAPEDFDALFNLLARRPDGEMRFLCDIG